MTWLRALPILVIISTIASDVVAEGINTPLQAEILKKVVAQENRSYARVDVPDGVTIPTGKDEFGDFAALMVNRAQRPQNGAVSSEIAVNYPYREGETIRYSWRMKIPQDFAADVPMNRWWLFARWKDEADLSKGERPETFLNHNPVMMLGYKLVGGKDTIHFSYGVPDPLTAATFTIPRGAWIKVAVEVEWSHGENGHAKIFVNDARLPTAVVTGVNIYGKNSNVFRVGMSRSLEIRTGTYIEVGDIKVERVTK